MHITLISVSTALHLLQHVNAVPAALVPDAVLDVKTTLRYCKKGAILEYSKEVDLGRQAHLDHLKTVQIPQPVVIEDIRGFESQFKWDVHGFSYVRDKVLGLEECKSDKEYDELLRPAAEELVKKMHRTNADAVYAFNSRVRDQDDDMKAGGRSRTPVPSVHSDFSPESAKETVKKAIADCELNSKEVKEFKALAEDENNRVVILHLWRPLQVIKKNPLALCDWRSVDIEQDSHAYRPRGPERPACIQWSFNPKNRWYYLNQQGPDEVAMFVQYDSAAKGHMSLPHASFEDPNSPSSPARRSIEVRMIAVFSKGSDMTKKLA
ncbi:uncharacterized protein MELLADRAFT_88185 [Melampsora larici-populina 98AG31]|uniref:Secreted protein n=1 Tax=Melampsora larici-populina (strain 98AG31 / pathotype 3-4-7) TaxID=747676 RepID=F4RQV9_MELLP|nr:uncharacterized protein MELLADRAFT_88185 [Melampsora larici-populina 98AG31]EGG05110.1 hypothetical protein MELLADRAFT_88185 [Melampsora larici-populina 98AG31]